MIADFYVMIRPTIRKVKEIFSTSYGQAIRTDVDMLNCKKSIRREMADKSFEKVMSLIDKRSVGSFRMIHREKEPIGDQFERLNVVELFIRSIDIGNVEYFIFMYLPAKELPILLKRYAFRKL
jgi:hypothetical protein